MNYSVILLDCDGVILDSNHIKTAAMREVVSRYGADLSHKFISYHRNFGGISRYEKFDYFLREIVGEYSIEEYDQLLAKFSRIVKGKLLGSPFTNGAIEFIKNIQPLIQLYVVSGGDQEEIRDVFIKRDISHLFSGIFGSPIKKDRHCKNILKKIGAKSRVLFIGDSRLDHESALDNGFDFVFVSRYTDFDDWQKYCKNNNIKTISDLSELSKI